MCLELKERQTIHMFKVGLSIIFAPEFGLIGKEYGIGCHRGRDPEVVQTGWALSFIHSQHGPWNTIWMAHSMKPWYAQYDSCHIPAFGRGEALPSL